MCPNFYIKLEIVHYQGIITVMEYLGVTINEEIRHVPESSWDRITKGLKFVQCQKLKCALKLFRKTEEYTFLYQYIPINNTI